MFCLDLGFELSLLLSIDFNSYLEYFSITFPYNCIFYVVKFDFQCQKSFHRFLVKRNRCFLRTCGVREESP